MTTTKAEPDGEDRVQRHGGEAVASRAAYLWLALVPVSLAADWIAGSTSIWTFVTGVAAIVPLADWVRRATEQLAARFGGAVGGLLNVSFGNTAELMLALFVLAAGHPDVVKGQITGSIVGNSLLGLGAAVLAGSFGRHEQWFNSARAGLLSTLMVLSTVALLLPALFDYTVRAQHAARASLLDEELSLGVAVVLIVVYAANLLYTLVTHRDVFAADEPGGDHSAWPTWISVTVLVAATAVTAFESHLVSRALDATATALGLSELFLGVVVLATIGNAAEYLAAIAFARDGRIGVAIGVTVGSTIQVALLLAPLLVFASWMMGRPMNLVFPNPIELVAIAAATGIVAAVARDAKTSWIEGVLLLAVYVLLAVAFYLV